MSILKMRKKSARVMFHTDARLAADLKEVEDAARDLNMEFNLDEHLTASLRKLLSAAKRELEQRRSV